MQEPLSGSCILSRVASDLKAARLQRGLSLDEVSRMVSLHKSHLESLEAGDFTFFAGPYVFAYIKEYLREMKLGDEALFEACRKELSVSTGLKRYPAPACAAPKPVMAFGASMLQAVHDFVFSRKKAMALVAGAFLVVAVCGMALQLMFAEKAPLASVPEAPSVMFPDSSSLVPSIVAAPVKSEEPLVQVSLPVPAVNVAVSAPAKPSPPPSPDPVGTASEEPRQEELFIPSESAD